MFRKIGKNKKDDNEGAEESNSNWDGADSKAKFEEASEKVKGPKEASVIYNGSKQVNVIVKGQGASPLAVPKSSKESTSQRNSDQSGDDGGFTSPDKNGCVEVDLHEDEEMVPDPRPPNWRQQFIKKLQQMHTEQRKPKNPNNTMPLIKKEKSSKLPGIFDFTAPPDKLRHVNLQLEYKFDEWSSDNLNPEYQDPPKKFSPVSYKVQSFGHKYWGEAFAIIQPVADFAIALILELLAFVSRITTRLVAGTFLRLTDLLIKPLLVFTFNALILPPFVLIQNIFRALANSTVPLFEILHRFMEVVAIPIQAFRLVEVKHINHYTNPTRNQPIPYSQSNTIEQDVTFEEPSMKGETV